MSNHHEHDDDDLMDLADAAGVTPPNRGLDLAEQHIAQDKAATGFGRPAFTPARYPRLDDFELWAFEVATSGDGYDATVVPALLAGLDARERRS